jgi:hypothetical protein
LGLQTFFQSLALNLYLELVICLSAGALTYGLVIGLTARPLYRQGLELVTLVLPRSKLRKIF